MQSIEENNINISVVQKMYANNIDYFKHSINSPMTNVTKEHNTYRVRINKFSQRSTDINVICKIALDMQLNNMKRYYNGSIQQLDSNLVKEGFCRCGGVFILIYWYNNEPYFDIRHIIHILKIQHIGDKMSIWRKEVTYLYTNINEYNGYDIHELISEDVMIRMIMGSTLDFAEKFKKNIAEVLKNLRKLGVISIDNNGKIIINEEKTNTQSKTTITNGAAIQTEGAHHMLELNKENDDNKNITKRKKDYKKINYDEIFNDLVKRHNIDSHGIISNMEIILEILEILDSCIEKYISSDDNPMRGIFKTENKSYVINIRGLTYEESPDLDKLATKAKLILIAKSKEKVIDPIINKSYGTKLISYLYEDIEYFDVLHFIKFIGLKLERSTDIKRQYQTVMLYAMVSKNKHNGYFIRHLISMNDAKQILMRSNLITIKNAAQLLGMNMINDIYLYKEQKFLSCLLESFNGEEIIPQFKCGTYKIDIYMPKYKLAIECDENNHIDRDEIYEKNREIYIKNMLKCEFIRFNPDDQNFNIFTVINKIFKKITCINQIINL